MSGSIFLYSTGSIQVLNMTDPDMVKELANCKSFDIGRPLSLQKERGALLGMGILASNGELWAHQRKVIAPEFFMDKVKGMLHVMVEAAMPMLTSWENITAETVVDESLRNFSAEVISRTSFGSNFAAGKEIFNKIRQLQIAMAAQSMLGVTGVRYVEEINLVTVSYPKGLVFVCLLLMLTCTTAALALIIETQTWNWPSIGSL